MLLIALFVPSAPFLSKLPCDQDDLLNWSSYSNEVSSLPTTSSGPVHSELVVNIVIYVVTCGRIGGGGGGGGGEVLRVLRLLSEILADKGIQEVTKNRVTVQVGVRNRLQELRLLVSVLSAAQLLGESELVGPQANDSHHLRSVAFSVFSRCRPSMQLLGDTQALTGFGPAVGRPRRSFEVSSYHHLKLVTARKPGFMFVCLSVCQVKPYSPPYILSPEPPLAPNPLTSAPQQQPNLLFASDECSLFCAYCVSADQRWLLAVVCDRQAELLDTCIIGIQPNR